MYIRILFLQKCSSCKDIAMKKVAYLLKFLYKLIPRILYDKMKLFMIKILKLIDNNLCLTSDLYSCQVERKQKYLIELLSEEAIGNFYN